MKNLYAFLFFLAGINVTVIAQNKLSTSLQSGDYTYLYRADEKTVEGFYRHKKFDEKLLTNPVDSFLTNSGQMPSLPAGNYIKVSARVDKLQYELIEKPTAYLQLLDNRKDLQFILLDRESQQISAARVQVNRKTVPFNSEARLWLARHPRKDSTLV